MIKNNIEIYLCEDNIESIFTAIYFAWQAGTSHTDVRCTTKGMNFSLFENYINVKADSDICEKVVSSIKKKLGSYAYSIIFMVINSNDDNKASVVYKSLQRLFKYGSDYLDNLHDEYIYRLFSIYRKVSNEAFFYREIIRFNENNDGFLVSRIEPDNNIIYMITDHFADRLFCENFIIYDIKRKFCYIHSAKDKGIFYSDKDCKLYNIINSYSSSDIEYQDLWGKFFETIAIKERINPKLQMNMIPLKYRKYLPEMNKNYVGNDT